MLFHLNGSVLFCSVLDFYFYFISFFLSFNLAILTESVFSQPTDELQRRFFNIPDICFDLAKTSKDTLVEEIDRSNLETKLTEFINRGLFGFALSFICICALFILYS